MFNLEDAGIVLRQDLALTDQSPNLLGPFFFLATGDPARAGGRSVGISNPSSCADWHVSHWRVEWEVPEDLREQVWILWLVADLILCTAADDSIYVVWREIYDAAVHLEIWQRQHFWDSILLI